ncbi:unnamed protein product [Tilletia controversa]|uniref:Uncharacterized protein n=3 Tax=Tilletia TaxID=13289 RepID=A0A8X7MZK7_9BASI|nr:hypothetical protein CF336_g1308 [Tilletia laevis]KAE8204863.1 hypothetical protein CF328_g837 [Tilletia controversa]KAE8261119.1 hypothetical protein A4X03_0g3524 [Tilletia caries]KAE8208515.1 hypothetical protein CF335_g359 [Tilletia laevis]KAE8254522.1 hypothetical protein A4X06_0g859 [Tilletia controversa]
MLSRELEASRNGNSMDPGRKRISSSLPSGDGDGDVLSGDHDDGNAERHGSIMGSGSNPEQTLARACPNFRLRVEGSHIKSLEVSSSSSGDQHKVKFTSTAPRSSEAFRLLVDDSQFTSFQLSSRFDEHRHEVEYCSEFSLVPSGARASI